ncbi:MAG: CARDB domain-containing protein [Patescibacteria group bacterium]
MLNFKKSVSMLFIIFGICSLFFATKTQAETGNPDLTVTGITFSGSQQGEIGKLAVTIKNLGGDLNNTAGLLNIYNNFSSQNFVFDSSTPSATQFKTDRALPDPSTNNPLKTNETITFIWYGSFNTSGNLYLQFTVDNANELMETNENNNTLSVSIPISAIISKPDLTVTDINFSSSVKNENGTLSVTVKNLGGNLTSGQGLFNWYNNLSAQNFIFSSETPSILAYRASRPDPTVSNPLKKDESITFSWVGKFNTSGNLYLQFTVDNANELDESNENNNTFSKSIVINNSTNNTDKKPDLTVTGITFSTNYANQIGTISVTIKNNGTASLTSSKGLLNTYFNLSNQNFVFNSETPIVSLKTNRPLPTTDYPLMPGESISRLWLGKFTKINNYYLEYTVDNGNELDELNESNNNYSSIITIDNNYPGTVNSTVTSNTANETIKTTVQTTEAAVSANRLYDDKLSEVLAELKQLRDTVKEQATKIKYFESLTNNVEKLSAKMETAINNFITYGADTNTQKLGAGERAAVMYSYKNAFDKLPETEAELVDVIKIANGRWPSITNQDAENKAKEQFQKIYKRVADMNNANDNAAVTVMAYGLRQKAENRNLNSETAGIKIFKAIYGHTPSSTEDWNIMQAITYSGASR